MAAAVARRANRKRRSGMGLRQPMATIVQSTATAGRLTRAVATATVSTAAVSAATTVPTTTVVPTATIPTAALTVVERYG